MTPVPAAGPAIIQVDICAEELHNSAPAAVALQVSSDWWRAGHVTSVLTSDWPQGDIRATVAALAAELAGFRFPDTAPWWTELRWAGIGRERVT